MDTRQYCTGLILAGGAGRRVGGRDKGLLSWQGAPLVEHVAQRLRPQVGRLLISCNRNREYYATLDATLVTDSRQDFQGPLAGIESAIPHISSEFLLVAPCDNPLLPLDLASRLLTDINRSDAPGVDICFAHDGERGQYLCAAIRCTALVELPAFLDQGHRAVRQWYTHQGCRSVDFSDRAECFANLNSRE